MTTVSAAQQRLDFMTLLVTELRNQNPLEPLEHHQMAAQLAQFTQLELTEKMNGNLETMTQSLRNLNSSFEGAMLLAQLDYAKSLLGRQVEFTVQDNGQLMIGQVRRVFVRQGQLMVDVSTASTSDSGQISTVSVPLERISAIQ